MSPYRDETPQGFEACACDTASYCGACCNLEGGCPWKRLNAAREAKDCAEKAEASALADLHTLTSKKEEKRKLVEPWDMSVALIQALNAKQEKNYYDYLADDIADLEAGQPDPRF